MLKYARMHNMMGVEMQGPLESAVTGALPIDADKGAAELARTYARAIDTGGELEKVGPLLLAVLESMLLTPKARAAAMKGAKDDRPAASPLDELRARRAARQRHAETGDTAAS